MLSGNRKSDSLQKILDSVCIFSGYLLAWFMAQWLSSKGLFVFPDRSIAEYRACLLLAVFSWGAVSSYMQVYHSYRAESLDFAVTKLLQALVMWVLATTAGVFLLKLHNISRQFMLYVFLSSGLFMIARQLATMAVVHRLWRFGYNWRTALIIGERSNCERFAELLRATYPMYRVVMAPLEGSDPRELLHSLDDPPEVEDAFIIPGGQLANASTLRLLKGGKSVHIVPELLDARLFRKSLGDVGGIPVISLLNGRLNRSQAAVKRVADIVGATLLLIVLLPVLLCVALIVKLSSKGPVFFMQRRLGQDGEPFLLRKFRTMVANAEELLRTTPGLYHEYVANNYKLPRGHDPRITRIGAFLRATSLDELPQLFNVIRGDMSLVGPRPVVPAEVEQYGDYALLFLSAKPGLTGHWQVSGRSEVGVYAQRVELDLEYIRDQSFGKDLEILLRTVPAVLLRRGAH
jgi:exopolysaccharide production protein ExoY